MEILGIGPQELIFIIIIALIVLGPKDMQKAGRTIGHWLNRLINSDGWKLFQQTSNDLRTLPNKLMREANLEMQEAEREIRKNMEFKLSETPSKPPDDKVEPKAEPDQPPQTGNTILPPPASRPINNESTPSTPEQGSETNTTDTSDQHA